MTRRFRPALVLATLFAAPLLGPDAARGQDARSEVDRLFEHAVVQRAMAHVEESDAQTMEDLVTLTEIPAPPFMEEVRGLAFRDMIEGAGIDSTWIDAVGNVIGLRTGSGGLEGAIVVSAHLDTVFPEGVDTSVRIRGDTLFAPGIGDDTRGLVAVLAILRAMNAADLRTDRDILFVGTVGEEGLGDLRGVKHLFRDGGPDIASFMSIDGLSDTRVVHMGLGSHRYRVAFKGPGGHSWGAFGLANPAHAMGRAITYFDLAADAFTRSGPRTSYNVGVVEGGTSVNSIPFETAIMVDMRSESEESLVQIDSIFQRSMRKAVAEVNLARRAGPELTVEIEMVGDRPSGEIPVDAAIVQHSIRATERFGLFAAPGRASTDSNVPISLGIPAVTLGGGGAGAGAHSPDEWFMNHNGPRGIQRAMLVLIAQAGLTPIGE